MASVFDVVALAIERRGPMTAMKLHKIAFYCQAMSLVHRGRPLFSERIEAWSNGPVIPELFQKLRGTRNVNACPWGNVAALDEGEKSAIEAALTRYGAYSAEELSVRSHAEEPWKRARVGLPPNQRGNREIPVESIRTFYVEWESMQSNPLVQAIERMTPADVEYYRALAALDAADDLSGAE